jgi:lipocalin
MKKTQVINRSDTTVKKVKRIEGVGCIKTGVTFSYLQVFFLLILRLMQTPSSQR